jgi:hypothetical protein
MEIQQTSFKMTILLRYSSYRNYLLRYMCINFLGNRPQADGEWQKLHGHTYTCDGLFICQLHLLPDLLEEMVCKEDTPLMLHFASFISLSQLIIVIWIKTSVGITTVFHMGISRAVAAA